MPQALLTQRSLVATYTGLLRRGTRTCHRARIPLAAGNSPKHKSTISAAEVRHSRSKTSPKQGAQHSTSPKTIGKPWNASQEEVSVGRDSTAALNTTNFPKQYPYQDQALWRDIKVDVIARKPEQDLSSTRPAPLEPTTPPNPDEHNGAIPVAVRAKYLYKLGRAFLSFYKMGLKNIWNNRKECQRIRKRLGRFSPVQAAWYGGQLVDENSKDGPRIPTITRREYQMCIRTRHDLQKLLPFALVFAICGEFTPIVIMALGTRVVPYTCHIPRQVEQDRMSLSRRFEGLKGTVWADVSLPERRLMRAYVLGASQIKSFIPILGYPLFHFRIFPRYRKLGNEILTDLILIRREGGFINLEPAEVIECAAKLCFTPWLRLQDRYIRDTGKVNYDPRLAEQIIPKLEEYTSDVLAQPWKRFPDQERWIVGVESRSLAE